MRLSGFVEFVGRDGGTLFADPSRILEIRNNPWDGTVVEMKDGTLMLVAEDFDTAWRKWGTVHLHVVQ